MSLTLKLLGEFSVRDRNGAVQLLPTRKTRALLAYLAVNANRPQPRERLTGLLWSDRGERQARQSLNQALLAIRKLGNADGAALLDSDGEQVTLLGDAIECDVQRLRSLVKNDPAMAASLYGGPFLDGLSIPDPGFEGWLLAIRSELHALACDALETVANSSEDIEPATNCARRLVTLEPLREDAHRRLMQLLRQAGDRTGALRQYLTCAEVLQRELQVEPDAATRHLYEEIRRDTGSTALGDQLPDGATAPPHAVGAPRAPRSDAPAPETSHASRRLVAGAAAAVLLIMLTGVTVWFAPWTEKAEHTFHETASLPLPDKPSIAVLPFVNFSDDASQEYFVDGMTEDLITDLSKLSSLFVIARNSAFTYKGKTVNVRQVARELGVRYVLEGSVRRVGNRIRINAQLVDAATGGHLWAERYDGAMDDVFGLQDQITRKITNALALELTSHEGKNVNDRGTEVIAAHDAFLKGWDKYLQSSPDDLVAALGHFQEAITLDPQYGPAHAALALTYWRASERFWEIHLGMGWNWARILMLKHLELALKEPSSIALGLASSVYVMQRRYDDAVAAARRAIALAPNSAEAHRALAYSLVMSGQLGEAREIAAKAWRFDPRSAGQHFFLLGLIAFSEARLEQSVALFERARTHLKYGQSFLPPLIAAYMHIERAKEGKALYSIYDEYFSSHGADLRNVMYYWPFKEKNVAARLADGLLLAGVEGQRGGFYNLSDDDRLTGKEIAKLFRKSRSKWMVHDVRSFGDYPMDLSDSFQDGGVVIRRHVDYFGFPILEYRKQWTGRYWIDGDLLCMDFERVEVGGIGCRPVFRKATTSAESVGPLVLVGVLGFVEITPSK